ncbi:outer membrane lipoprotein carrier protein LolA [Camelimonas abortus]|uniref:Outer membrane lipoprotein carrier protein LolA n=1 Tax=Camelimonas abortus TaxID=1017184 RepID=A0ABV7LC40_9HYPH
MAVAPLPPRRPQDLGGATAAATPARTPGQGATVARAVEAAKAAARGGGYPAPKTPAEALARVNNWLNAFEAIQARFVQHDARGQKAEGSLYVRRPGQLVFKYDPPSTLEIVADGKSVAVRDSKLRTNDVYSIGQTPLKFLVKDHVDLARDTNVLNVSTDADGIVRVALSDSSTLGGTSKITLIFDSRKDELRQWNIIDPQGFQTSVALHDLRATMR